ncbi:ADP-ribosylglycohydrolase family protein [Neobacillus sp. OS1-32]|uniref:ADP-ribosylglycohydrolase family protein n=1 Tax=Neobacillus paridis TaxID=2803862 RepID=A0ABS1TPS8_9BACI|nr:MULTISPECIES: ADP-ribosylglycohydrolase family protein [Neobacillus]MBL4953262.1 ADP-ribosylglycohydrolase family protein [Neobacillus paridis]WML29654.1 ADP-ribosylglycohydrolase family protein [Neobacillus sp. OS1-32]
MNPLLDRAYGCLIATAIGDALGMPASFMSISQIKQEYSKITDFVTPSREQVAHSSIVAGGITDDTQESLIVSSVLKEAGKFDTELFILKMKEWAVKYNILESTVIGPSTRLFLETIISGGNYLEAGKKGDTNGAAMRVAPIGIFHHHDFELAIQDAIASALPSHGSKPGVASACAIAAAVSKAIEGKSLPSEIMVAAILGAIRGEESGYDIPSPSVAARIHLAMEIVDRNQDKPLEEICLLLYKYIGAGMKSYESIPLSLGVFYAAKGSVTDGLIAVVNLGDDADTNGAIVGSLCGAYSGASTINKSWIEKIEKVNSINFKEIAQDLLKTCS